MSVTTAPQHTSVEASFKGLWHICETHLYVGECGPNAPCVALCGKERTIEKDRAPEDKVDPADVCVVCDSLWEAA